MSGVTSFTSVPIIDISGLSSPERAEQHRVATELGRAAAEVGFFYISNTGIDESLFSVMLAAVGILIGGGALVGQGIVNLRAGDRTVTVRGLSEREVKADLAVLPLRFTASGEVLSDVQARIVSFFRGDNGGDAALALPALRFRRF